MTKELGFDSWKEVMITRTQVVEKGVVHPQEYFLGTRNTFREIFFKSQESDCIFIFQVGNPDLKKKKSLLPILLIGYEMQFLVHIFSRNCLCHLGMLV